VDPDPEPELDPEPFPPLSPQPTKAAHAPALAITSTPIQAKRACAALPCGASPTLPPFFAEIIWPPLPLTRRRFGGTLPSNAASRPDRTGDGEPYETREPERANVQGR
jgi:hypothetical protein